MLAMAWRNLWRNTRRTLITLFSFAFGVMLAIIFTGLGDANYGKMIELASRLGSGHVSFQHPEYLEMPALERRISGVPELLAKSRADEGVTAAVERITGAAMVATASNSTGAMLLAIDPEAENANTLAVLANVAEGEFLTDADDKGALVGAAMAETLGIGIGKKLVFTMTDPEGEIVSGLARVKGIIRTGTESVDAGLLIMAIGHTRKTIGYAPDEATMIAVFGSDHRQTEELAGRFRAMAPPEVATLTWQQTQPDFAGFIAIDRGSNIFFQLVIMLLISAGIFNSLFISVMERQREFGIMLALGFSALQTFVLVVSESAMLALMGLFAAALLTAWPYYYLSTVGIDFTEMVGDGGYEVAGIGMEPIMRVGILPSSLVVIAVLSFCVTVIAGIYPALRAGRFEPVETIRLQ